MNSQKKMSGSDRKKRGLIFLAIALICVLISVSLPESNTLDTQAAVIIVSVMRGLISFGLLIFFFAGLYYLITGFTKKESQKENQDKPVEDNEINPDYEKRLKTDFGLSLFQDQWAFEGGTVVDEMASQLSEPDLCLGVLKDFQARMDFSQICIILTSSKGIYFVCNTKPKPTCIAANLSSKNIADFIFMVIKEGGEQAFIYRGTWLLTLPSTKSKETASPQPAKSKPISRFPRAVVALGIIFVVLCCMALIIGIWLNRDRISALPSLLAPATPTSTPTLIPVTSTSTITPTITNTPYPTPNPPTETPEPFVIQDSKFEADYKGDCSTDASITSVQGTTFEAKGNISMRDGRFSLWCYGARHTWVGTLTYAGYTFASDESDPLQFELTKDNGYVYIKGKGTVTRPDGTQAVLPYGGKLETEKVFSADFNDPSFDGSFDSGQWTYQPYYSDISIKQMDGAMVLSKPSPLGMESGNLMTKQTWSYGEFSYIEARLKLDQKHTGEMGNSGFSLGNVGCSVQIQGKDTTPFIWCAQSHKDSSQQWIADYMSDSYFIEYDKWYTVRIKFDSQTNQFTCSIDGKLFYSWQPANIDDLLKVKSPISVGVWADNGTAITGYVDDVHIVK
jgi:hypothetical protein